MSSQKIFFSYSRIDGSDFALQLALDLKKEGFNVWIDQQDIRAGLEWDREIEKALESCDCLLFVETEMSVTSNNVLDEVYYAIEQKKKVIPLIVRDSKTPFRLQRLQHINFTHDYNAGLTQLISELKGQSAVPDSRANKSEVLKTIEKPFNLKYATLILIITSLVIVFAAIIYTAKDNNLPLVANDTVHANTVTNEPGAVSEKDTVLPEKKYEKNEKIPAKNKEVSAPMDTKGLATTTTNSNNKEVKKPANNSVSLQETFAGDWQLIDVEPKAKSVKGYLKIEPIDENKVTIKSYFQFYYFPANDTSYVSVFNGFAGCASCILSGQMKITAEDIAVGSQTYRTLKTDEPGGGKFGDTILNAGANKSIRAAVTLHLINNKTAVIKVQRPVSTELSYGLVLQPFVYSFKFTKTDY
jgi:hypothetical protein